MIGCGAAPEREEPRPAAPAAAQRPDLGIARLDARIGGDRVASAGIVLDADRGLVVTSAHPLWGATSLKVTTGLAVLHGRIVARDACDDLALVEVQPRLPGLVALRPSDDAALRSGRAVRVVRRHSRRPSGAGADLETVAAAPASSSRPARRGARRRRRRAPCRSPARCRPRRAAPRCSRPTAAWPGWRSWAARTGARPPPPLPWERIAARLAELRSRPAHGLRRLGAPLPLRARPAPPRRRRGIPASGARDARLNAPVPATRLPGTGKVDA